MCVQAPVSTEATSESAPVAEETKPEVKATEVDAKAEDKKKAKLGRRLSARMFGLISSVHFTTFYAAYLPMS